MGAPVPETDDFGFIVYSREADVPTPTPSTPTPTATPVATPTNGQTPAPTANVSSSNTTSQSTGTTPQPGVTAGSGNAPVAPTVSIKMPANATVMDVPNDQGNQLQVDWKASTTGDIDGYKVFRSTEEKKNFTEVAKTEKAVLSYIDTQATTGTTYFYFVRAYKGSGESTSSNTVNGVSSDNTPPASLKNVIFEMSKDGKVTFQWDGNTDPDLAGYTLAVGSKADRTTVLQAIEIAKEATGYTLDIAGYPVLQSDGEYEYILTTKDTNGNISEQSIAVEKTAEVVDQTVSTKGNPLKPVPIEEESNKTIWYVSAGILAVLLLAATGFYWFKKKKKPVEIPVVDEPMPIQEQDSS